MKSDINFFPPVEKNVVLLLTSQNTLKLFLGAQSVAGRRQPSNKCVVAVETKEYPKINLRAHCGGIFSKQRIAIRITPRGLPAFAGDFAKGRLVRHLVFSVASFA